MKIEFCAFISKVGKVEWPASFSLTEVARGHDHTLLSSVPVLNKITEQ